MSSGGGSTIFGGAEGAVSSFLMSAVQATAEAEFSQQQTEIFESVGRDNDFDQRNDENLMQQYNRFASATSIASQQNQSVIVEDADAKKSQATFSEAGKQSMEGRKMAELSRQAQIAQRLLKIRKEIAKLGKELKSANS